VFNEVFSEQVNFTLLVAALAFDEEVFTINGWLQIIMSGFLSLTLLRDTVLKISYKTEIKVVFTVKTQKYFLSIAEIYTVLGVDGHQFWVTKLLVAIFF
jgi:hypothetical protein